MARTETFTFASKDRRTQVHGIKWLPDSGNYTAILQITHGMQEYIERYQDFAGFLTRQGFLVVGHDHIGHGASIVNGNDWGYFAEKNSSDILVEDMQALRKQIQKENPKLPYFMLGHSMGSYMLRKYITRYAAGLSGVVIMGTGSVPDSAAKMGMWICKILAKIRGWRYRSKFVQNLTMGKPYRKYDLTGKDLKNTWLTKDTSIAEAYYKDPKCTYRFTLSGYYGLMEAVLYDNQKENIAKIPKNLPVFLVSGSEDPVGGFGEGVKKVYRQYEEAGIGDVTWKLYENDRHEILNETDRDTVYRDIYAWLNVHKVL